jgi:phosphatidylserine decarboxylase
VYEKELGYHLSFSLYDYRQLGVNSLIGSLNLPLTGFTDNPEQRLTLPLELVPANPNHREQAQAPPMLLLKGTFHGLQNLQETFWRALCKQFDQNDSGSLDFVELELMLSCVAPNLSEDSVRAISEVLGTSRGRTTFDYGEIASCLSSQNLFDTRSVNGISVGECPICTKILQNEQSGYDVLMHVAVCAERNASGKLENVMMGGFLTEEHASRKWLARLFSFVSYGGYQLGKNNANIFVQDRMTGKVMEEKMPAYIRLGIRLIYQSSGGTRADTKMIRKIMQSMTLRQGRKFSSFESRKSILPFIKFHGLAVDEVLDPIDSFRTFNEFFYRKLKPGARKAASMDPAVSLCPADCRLSCFPSIDEATRIWVKGTNFTVTSLLRDGQLGEYFAGGSMAICRLAPQDYHRFHSPYEATINLVYHIPGAYFTVNPMAIRQRIDVFTENARTVVILDSPVFGKIAYVAIGAMMVGSIEITCGAGDQLARLDEIGYFAFGGSTIVMLFPPGAHVFDEDLLENSRECLETLVKVGQTLGHKL